MTSKRWMRALSEGKRSTIERVREMERVESDGHQRFLSYQGRFAGMPGHQHAVLQPWQRDTRVDKSSSQRAGWAREDKSTKDRRALLFDLQQVLLPERSRSFPELTTGKVVGNVFEIVDSQREGRMFPHIGSSRNSFERGMLDIARQRHPRYED